MRLRTGQDRTTSFVSHRLDGRRVPGVDQESHRIEGESCRKGRREQRQVLHVLQPEDVAVEEQRTRPCEGELQHTGEGERKRRRIQPQVHEADRERHASEYEI